MPSRNRKQKRGRRMPGQPGYVRRRRNKNRVSQDTLFWRPLNHQIPLPPRLHTKFTSVVYGFTTNGVGSGDYSWGLFANALYKPFDTATWSGLTFNNVASTTIQPAGFTALCNPELYTRYRVLESVISVDVLPQSIEDGCVLSIAPGAALGPVVSGLMNQPWAKSHTFASGRTSPSRNGLTNRLKVHRIYGVPKQSVLDDVSGAFDAQYNSTPTRSLFWILALESGDNTVLNKSLEVRIEVTYTVELFGLVGAFLPIDAPHAWERIPKGGFPPSEIKEEIKNERPSVSLTCRVHKDEGPTTIDFSDLPDHVESLYI